MSQPTSMALTGGIVTRRRLLGAVATLAGAAAVVGPGQLLGTSKATAGTQPLPYGEWSRLIGQTFVFRQAGRATKLRLLDATESSPQPLLVGMAHLFVLAGPLQPALLSTAGQLVHPAIGRQDVSLFAIDRPTTHQLYQLIIDQRRPVSHNRSQ
jgi:drug/metabolite transporter (DMT)-like permease